MESKVPQYQRAVTPTIIDSNASPNLVRGKVLSYNTNIIRGGRGVASTGDKLFGSMNTVSSPYPPSASGSLSPRGNTGVLDGSQGRSTSGKSVGGVLSAKFNTDGIAGGSAETLATAFSVLPRYDLVPLSNELPSDGVIFAKTKSSPEALVVFRTTEERLRNPERLNLDRRQLEVCPLLEQEQRLRLLNFQNNSIRSIQNLENLPNLIFLDLYNNKITSLEGPLSTVKGLRVLMAGKNKISSITNLHPLRKLDVLDLHSNEIRLIEGLDGLSDLRVLNLAGNRINIVNNLSSLVSLTELNLRRNNIDSVTGLNQLPALQRVFLSHNSISRLDDVRCLFEVSYLIELSLDGNPVSEAGGDSSAAARYRAQLVVGMPGLRHLDLKRVTEEERAGAALLMGTSDPPEALAGGVAAGVDNTKSGQGTDKEPSHKPSPGLSRRKESRPDLAQAVQPLVLSDYDSPFSADHNKDSGAENITGYVSDDADRATMEGGGNVAKTSSRDERDAEDRPSNRAAGAVGSSSPGQTLPRTHSLERKGLQKYVSLAADATLVQSGTSSAGIAHLQGLQGHQSATLEASSGCASSSGAGLNKSGVATTSTGLAALARAGKVFNTNSVFDLEIIGPDEKALIAVGDGWEWTSNKRLLQNVTEASLYHMKRATLISRFGSIQLAALPVLKCMRFVFNDFSSLKNVEFIPALYGRQLEQLTVKNSPLCTSCSPNTLRAYFVASLPRLTEFNDEEVTALDRAQAEMLFGPLLKAQRAQEQQKVGVVAAAAVGAASGVAPAGGGGPGRQPGRGQHGGLLRALHQQTQAASKYSLGAPAAGANVPPLPPFMAPAQHSVGSASLDAMRQSLTNPADPTPGSSGLSQRALQRRRQYDSFCAAFDDALEKIVLESVLEMKTLSTL